MADKQASVTGIQEPEGYSEAGSGLETDQWMAARVLEVKSLETIRTGTLELVDRPQSRKVIPGR